MELRTSLFARIRCEQRTVPSNSLEVPLPPSDVHEGVDHVLGEAWPDHSRWHPCGNVKRRECRAHEAAGANDASVADLRTGEHGHPVADPDGVTNFD